VSNVEFGLSLAPGPEVVLLPGMSSRKALLFAGGWAGHQPEVFAQRFVEELRPHQIETTVSSSLDCLTSADDLRRYDLIIPYWTMGQLGKEQTSALVEAVRAGVNLAGIHGGMGDAFRGNLDYEWMVGGHFVSHPHVGDYHVRLTRLKHPITEGLPADFSYHSEQYYMLIDPAVQILAETDYRHDGQTVTMPVAWTRTWGRGRVFYNSLGHDPKEFDVQPAAWELTLRGLRWAAGLL
jgi:uncharacterized protein